MKIILPDDCGDHSGDLYPAHCRRLNRIRIISLGIADEPHIERT
jgi:hypothetical protein